MSKKNLYNALLIVAIIINISFFKLVVGPTYLGWLSNVSFILALFLIPSLTNYGTRAAWAYVFLIGLGLILHIGFTQVKYPVVDAVKWIFLIFLCIASGKYELWKITKYILYFLMTIHCGIAIFEYLTQSNLFKYVFVEAFSYSDDIRSFRAFGLMEHPLYAANVLIIFLSFILVSDRISNILRITVLMTGTFALLTFNARAAIVVWFALMAYRFLRTYKILGSITVLLVVGMILGELPLGFIIDVDFLGRLGEVGFSDASSLNRLISYVVFFEESWSLADIVAGGRVLFIPGSDFSLESGILLTIAWWGWFVGLSKIILELIVTYQVISYLKQADRLIVMVACWVTAFANNNSVNTFVLFFILICAIVFRYKMQPSQQSFFSDRVQNI